MSAPIALLELIHAEFEARLNTIGMLAAEVASTASGDPSKFPAVNLDDSGLQPTIGTELGVTLYEYRLSVEGTVEGSGGPATRAERNALYHAVVAAIMIDTDLGGLVEEIEESDTKFGVSNLTSKRHASFLTYFIVRFRADQSNPSQ